MRLKSSTMTDSMPLAEREKVIQNADGSRNMDVETDGDGDTLEHDGAFHEGLSTGGQRQRSRWRNKIQMQDAPTDESRTAQHEARTRIK